AFQVLQHRLVDGAIALESARGLLTRAAAAEASGARAALLSAMAEIAAAGAASRIVDDGMRLMVGSGVSREYAVQRYFRDARLYTFAPLTNEMLRNYLGERMLGLPRSFGNAVTTAATQGSGQRDRRIVMRLGAKVPN